MQSTTQIVGYDDSGWWPTLALLLVTTSVSIIRFVRDVSRRNAKDWHAVEADTAGVYLWTMHSGSQLQARAVTAPLSLCDVRLIANPRIQSDQFPIWKEPSDTPVEVEIVSAARLLRAQGWPLSEWVSLLISGDSFTSRLGVVPAAVLMACNGIQSNFISPFGFTVTDSKVIRPLRAIKKYPILAGTEVWALVLQPREIRGLRRIRLADANTQSAIDVTDNTQSAIDAATGIRIVSAIEGPPLVHGGRNVAHTIASSTGQRARPNAVLWPVPDTRAAFSAVGIMAASGHVAFVSVISQDSAHDVADRVRRLGVQDAVLCGGSADVQQWVNPRLCTAVGPALMIARSRKGSTNPGSARRLNSVFVLTRK